MYKINFDNPNYARWLLQIGLAATLAYAGIGSLLQPAFWIGYLPTFLGNIIAPNVLIALLGIYELLLAVWLLSGHWLKWAGLLCALTFSGIILVNLQSFIITFRDIGLLFAALALIFMPDKTAP